MENVLLSVKEEQTLSVFLQAHNFAIEELEHSILKVQREGELPVFIKVDDEQIYFEVDLGNVSEIADECFYFTLLDMNTEILPVSFGINNTNAEDPRLVLVESRETGDLSSGELLSVFAALELAVDKAAALLDSKLN